MKSLFTFLVFFTFLNPTYSQKKTNQKETPYKYIITDSKYNGVSNSAFDLDREGFLVFIVSEDSSIIELVNDSDIYDSFSYGQISKLDYKVIHESEREYRSDSLSFKWHYRNSYDDNTGYASVTLTRIFKPQGTIFNFFIVLPNLDVIEYSGYIESTLNFHKLYSSSSKI